MSYLWQCLVEVGLLYILGFWFSQNAAYLTMGHKKGRRLRKIEVPTDSVPEFELEDTAADIQWGREERETREREETQKQ